MALRVFAGGDPLDIALVHGVSVRVVHYSVARVVNAINACPSLNINFPTHQQQLQIANEFKLKSNAGFSNCVGCIDGILIWIQKPTWHEALDANIGQQKFLCGRKKKCGFNMQAVCDHHGRFIDTDVSHPGATSDCLAFMTSDLKNRIDNCNLLAPGMALFGDNARMNSPCVAVPFKRVCSGAKDDFNIFQSQVNFFKINCFISD